MGFTGRIEEALRRNRRGGCPDHAVFISPESSREREVIHTSYRFERGQMIPTRHPRAHVERLPPSRHKPSQEEEQSACVSTRGAQSQPRSPAPAASHPPPSPPPRPTTWTPKPPVIPPHAMVRQQSCKGVQPSRSTSRAGSLPVTVRDRKSFKKKHTQKIRLAIPRGS